MAQQNNLSQQRLDQINSLKKNVEALTNYFNEAFTGNASIQRQDGSIQNILHLAAEIQSNALQIRELNSNLVVKHQMAAKMNQLRMMESSYRQMTQAMNAMQSVMALDDPTTGLVDNANYGGPIKSLTDQDNNSGNDQDGDQGNFSQPGQDPAAAMVSDDNFATASVSPVSAGVQQPTEKVVDDSEADEPTQPTEAKLNSPESVEPATSPVSAEPVQSSQPSEQATEPSQAKSASQEESAEESEQPKSTRGGFKRLRRAPQKAIEDQNVSASDGIQSAQVEFERHRQEALADPERIKERLAEVKNEKKAEKLSNHQDNKESKPPHHSFALKWAGTKHFVNKDGSIADNPKDEIRDVTPHSEKLASEAPVDDDSDHAAIDNLLKNELDKFN